MTETRETSRKPEIGASVDGSFNIGGVGYTSSRTTGDGPAVAEKGELLELTRLLWSEVRHLGAATVHYSQILALERNLRNTLMTGSRGRLDAVKFPGHPPGDPVMLRVPGTGNIDLQCRVSVTLLVLPRSFFKMKKERAQNVNQIRLEAAWRESRELLFPGMTKLQLVDFKDPF